MKTADKGLIGSDYQNELRASSGINLQTAVRANMEEKRGKHFITNRITRKVLAHTVCAFINKKSGNPPLQFELLLKP